MICIQAAQAQSAVKTHLYKEGRIAFTSGDYLTALDRFTIFRDANQLYLERHDRLDKAIAAAIKKSEVELEKARQEEEKRRQEEENRRNGIVSNESHLRVAALMRPPLPIFLLPKQNVPRSEDWKYSLYEILENEPFATVTVTCLSNHSENFKSQSEYVHTRIEKLKEIIKKIAGICH